MVKKGHREEDCEQMRVRMKLQYMVVEWLFSEKEGEAFALREHYLYAIVICRYLHCSGRNMWA